MYHVRSSYDFNLIITEEKKFYWQKSFKALDSHKELHAKDSQFCIMYYFCWFFFFYQNTNQTLYVSIPYQWFLNHIMLYFKYFTDQNLSFKFFQELTI